MTRMYLRSPNAFIISGGAMTALSQNDVLAMDYLGRFELCDWDECSEEERKANSAALEHGGHVTAVYKLPDGRKLSVGTHGDHSVVVMTLPEEY
jgi:hypothetical protein